MSAATRWVSRVAGFVASLGMVGFGIAKLNAARQIGVRLAVIGLVEVALGVWLLRSKSSARSASAVLIWAVVALIVGEAAETGGDCHCLGEFVALAPRARRLILPRDDESRHPLKFRGKLEDVGGAERVTGGAAAAEVRWTRESDVRLLD